MSRLRVPDILALGRWWSGDELDAIAGGWRAAVLDALGDRARLIAAALPASPEAVALFAALTSLPSPMILLSHETRAWRTEPAIPIGTPLVLLPTLAHLAPEGEKLGLVPLVLPDAPERRAGGRLSPWTGRASCCSRRAPRARRSRCSIRGRRCSGGSCRTTDGRPRSSAPRWPWGPLTDGCRQWPARIIDLCCGG